MNDAPIITERESLFTRSPRQAAAAVIISAGLAILSVGPILYHLITLQPWGTFGFSHDGSDFPTVEVVTPGGAAALAGLKVGDQIDIRATPPQYHRDVDTGDSYWPGAISVLHIVRAGRPMVVRLVSQPMLFTSSELIGQWLSRLRVVVFLSVGLTLVLLRPSKMTWGFYLFSLSALGWVGTELYLPWKWAIAWSVLGDIVNQVGVIGFLVFALRFPRDNPYGWKRAVDIAAPYVIVVAGLGAGVCDVAECAPALGEMFEVGTYVVLGLAVAALLSTFIDSNGEDRRRLQWVIAGCVIGFAAYPQKLFLTFALPDWTGVWVFSIAPLLIPLSVAYGVLVHRVLDIRLAAARSLTYAVLIGLLAICILAADWLAVRISGAAGTRTLVLVAAATLFGIALALLAGRLRGLIDHSYFRARFDARERLAQISEAVRHADTVDVLKSLLTLETANALDLSSSAIFMPQSDEGFTRETSFGWPAGTDWHVLPGDAAASTLATKSVTRIAHASALGGLAAPQGLSAPVLAVPVTSDGALYASIVYGAHSNSAGVNADEIRELRWLAAEAAATWRSLVNENTDFNTPVSPSLPRPTLSNARS